MDLAEYDHLVQECVAIRRAQIAREVGALLREQLARAWDIHESRRVAAEREFERVRAQVAADRKAERERVEHEEQRAQVADRALPSLSRAKPPVCRPAQKYVSPYAKGRWKDRIDRATPEGSERALRCSAGPAGVA